MKRFFSWLGLLCFLWMSSCSAPNETSEDHSLKIDPPFESISVSPLEFVIDNSADTLISLENGSSVFIPKNAFETADGQAVDGEVKIQLKQYDSPEKIMASGIPMTFLDLDSSQQQMESGGMIDIRGTSQGKEIFIKEDKELEIGLASNAKGDYDLFYFDEVEKGKSGNWDRLLKNTLTDGSEDTSGRFLHFDTANQAETKLLEQLRFNIKPLDSGDHNWIYDEVWSVLDISKPKQIPNKLAQFKNEMYFGDGFYSNHGNSKYLFTRDNDEIFIRNWKGEILKKFNGKKYHYMDLLVDNNIVLKNHYDGLLGLYDEQWALLKSFSSAFNHRLFNKGRHHIFTNLSKSTTTHFFHDIVDLNGQLISSIKCKKHPRKSHWYGKQKDQGNGITEYKINTTYDLIASNTGDGIAIYDSNGKLLQSLKKVETFSEIDFIKYEDALFVKNWDGEDFIWDWRSNKQIPVPSEIISDAFIDYSGHPSEPLLTISNRKAKFYLIWNWKKDSYTKIPTSHAIGQISYDHSSDSVFIEEYLYDAEYERLWNEEGKEIIKVKSWPEEHSYFSTLDSGRYLFSSNSRELKLYHSNGKPIRTYPISDSTYTSFSFFYNKIGLLASNGKLSFIDFKGSYSNSIQIDPFSKFGRQHYSADTTLISAYSPNNCLRFYNHMGELQYNLGSYHTISLKTIDELSYLLGIGKGEKYSILRMNKADWDENEYQIILQKEKKQFIGAVRLTYQSKKQIEKYQEEYLKNYRIKQKKESLRKYQELKLVRSFRVKKFGIYNWDRMYKEAGTILCKAKFNFTPSDPFKDYTSYLITGEKKNVVIKYSGEEIEKFAFNPTLYNQLIVVLPDDKIGIYTNEQFKNIKHKGLSKESELVFNFTQLEKAESMDYLNKIMN